MLLEGMQVGYQRRQDWRSDSAMRDVRHRFHSEEISG